MRSYVKTVSIIIPCYNCSSTVGETLQSLEDQTYKDFEVICINDGSTDDSLKILENIKNKNTLNLRIINQSNSGVSAARNRGIELSKGKKVLFLDSDDIYNKYFLQYMVNAIESKEVDCAFCRLSRNLDEVKDLQIESFSFVIQEQKESMKKLLFEMGKYGFYCYIYDKDILVENRIKFDEGTRYFEDREFNWKYLCHCKSYAWIDLPLYGYRVGIKSAMRKNTTWNRLENSFNAVKRVEEYLKEQECEYYEDVKSFLYHRVAWSIAKNIARDGDLQLFKRLIDEYNLKICMKRTVKDRNYLVRIASILYLINPMLFFFTLCPKTNIIMRKQL